MLLKNIHLQNFRSFNKVSFNFSATTTAIVGPNTAGKTNLLEAVYLLATGKSFRASLEEEMIQTGTEFSRVKGAITLPAGADKPAQAGSETLEVILTRGEVGGERVNRKMLKVNNLGKRLVDYQGILRVVIFGPWDLELIIDSPSVRRKFLDSVLLQVDREYRRSVMAYEKGLRSRNRLLERIREENLSRSQLLFWDKLLIKNGDYISQKREELIDFINQTKPLSNEQFQLIYDKSAISEGRLAQYSQEEVAAATTLVGPHRDNIIFQVLNSKLQTLNLEVYGSRGEQRMCALWIKLAELAFIEQATATRPVLLLDDIFSELDHEHREVVMNVVGEQQTILTTADPHMISGLPAQAGLKNGLEKIELG
ncbi:DNA replication and repair protein RecF [Candidatus Microgenomates bacterium]|nr:DNA replication and repair protein RecF [Candidatus Microgenomates bacterium]